MQYTVEYLCGHKGLINLVGKHSYREYRLKQEEHKICHKCYEKELEETNKKALLESKEMELPDLIGTEKQVNWANSIRLEKLKEIEKKMETQDEQDEYYKIYEYLLEKTKASDWINARNWSIYEYINIIKREMNELQDNKSIELPEIIRLELTIKPNNIRFDGIVELKSCLKENKEYLTAHFYKNNDFIKIMKQNNFRWDGSVWKKVITEFTGSFQDREAELGAILLDEGFCVQFSSEESKVMALSGTYQLEHTRWVKWSNIKNKFYLDFERSNSLYKKAKTIPSASYINGFLYVNVNCIEALEDFAQLYDFKFSHRASQSLLQIKKQLDAIKVGEVVQKDVQIEQIDQLEMILKNNTTIITDLIDE